jgi:hypothetical protein
MYAKFSIPFRGVSSFMGSSAGIWGWHMCKKDRMNRFGLQSQSESVNAPPKVVGFPRMLRVPPTEKIDRVD